jgi:hypothetical protein
LTVDGSGPVSYREWTQGRADDRHALHDEIATWRSELLERDNKATNDIAKLELVTAELRGALAIARFIGFTGLLSILAALVYVSQHHP